MHPLIFDGFGEFVVYIFGGEFRGGRDLICNFVA